MGIDFARLRNLDTGRLTTSADTAVLVGKDVETRAGEIADLLKGDVSAMWAGLDEQAQAELLGAAPPPLRAASSVFKAAAGTLDTLVTELEGAKADIETAISSYPEHTVAADGTVSWPPSPDAATQARLAEQAKDLFELLLKAVERADAADQSATGQLAGQNPNGGQGPVPVTLPDGSVYLATGEGDNVVKVSNGDDGKLVATVDGKEVKFDAGTRLTLDGQGGDDRIDIDENVREDVTVLGGDGDDTIDGSDKANVIHGGEGADVIDGRGGEDTIVGGDGENTLRGGDGKDTIVGGADADEIHGGNDDDRVYTGGNPHNNKFVQDYDVVYGNDGDDTIVGADGEDRVAGGAGNDTISGGQGEDYLDGQDGDDTISGGAGDDVVYGLDGKDTLRGDEGRDYLEGGKDSDFVYGGDGNDVISGGRGDDYLYGQGGDDNIYAGHGSDVVDGGDGIDQAFTQPEDAVTEATENVADTRITESTGFIDIEGTPDFQDRIQADLDLYAASPTGQQMLDSLRYEVEKSGEALAWPPSEMMPGEDSIKISEYAAENGAAHRYSDIADDGETSSPGLDDWANDNPHMQINPALTGPADGVPSTVLYHELAHTYDNMTHEGTDSDRHTDRESPDSEPGGQGVRNSERTATGLPIDHDRDPDTELAYPDNHPRALTENALRAEMGLPPRTTYGLPVPPTK